MKRHISIFSKIFATLSVTFFNFSLAFAQTPPASSGCRAPNNIGELFTYAICILSVYVVPFLIGLAVVMFLVGVLKYVKSGDNEEAREAGRGLMIFGIIALFVMVAVWGFVKILFTTFFPNDRFEIQALPPQSSSPFKAANN